MSFLWCGVILGFLLPTSCTAFSQGLRGQLISVTYSKRTARSRPLFSPWTTWPETNARNEWPWLTYWGLGTRQGSTPGLGIICGLSLLLVLFSAPRSFSPGIPVYPSPQKPTFLNSNSISNFEGHRFVTLVKQSRFIYLFTYDRWHCKVHLYILIFDLICF